jgi:EAL domain-containing protein (putative c-di-GMP-specific phosphodiesterase class I)
MLEMAHGAAIDFSAPVNRSAMPATSLVMLAIRLDNLAHLARAYGERAPARALDFVQGMLRNAVGSGGAVDQALDGVLTAVVWDPRVIGGDISEAGCARFVRVFGANVAAVSFAFENADLRVVVSGVWALTPDVRSDPDLKAASETLKSRLASLRFVGEPASAEPDWTRRYKADMARASWLLAAMSDERLLPVWQPVRSGVENDAVLYHECLLRVLTDGQQESAGSAIGALERLGLVALFDRYVVWRVIEELRRDADVRLGANISAQSVWLSDWWAEVIEQLRQEPDVARRLVIEITETAQFQDVGQAASFATGLRKLGVKIALDDFGVGHASLRSLLAMQPDIIKIDAFFLRRTALSERDRVALHHLIGLAGSFVTDVVVEGVETAEEFELALEAGAVWLQGYHMGRPSVVRPWLRRAVEPNVLALFDQRPVSWHEGRRAVG